MASKLRQIPSRRGPATVRLKSGSTYVGHVTYDGRAVTVKGRLEVKDLTGVSYRSLIDRTIPFGLVRSITWT